MSMCNSADIGECAIKLKVSRSVGRGLVFAFYYVSVEVDNGHIDGRKIGVINTGGLDYYQPFFSVDAADITPSEYNETMLNEHHISFVNLFL